MNPFNAFVSISILSYNRSHLLKKVLDSLIQLTYQPLEIIVVDNCSTDGTNRMLTTEYPSIRYHRTAKNIGTAARNVGLDMAKGEFIITLDDDIYGLNDENIHYLAKLFSQQSNVGAVCFKVIGHHSGDICNWCHHYSKDKYHNKMFITDEISEGAVCFRKSALKQTGGYPDYFFISHEGHDLLLRLLDAGFLTLYSSEVVVKHYIAQEGRPSWRRYYYDTRNLFWVAVRNYPFLWSVFYICKGLFPLLVYSIRDGFIIYWIKGIRDGLAGLKIALKDRKPIRLKSQKVLKQISKNRPPLWIKFKDRLFQKSIQL